MNIDKIINEVIEEQDRIEGKSQKFYTYYPQAYHLLKYQTEKYNRSKERGKILFKKFLKRTYNKCFLIRTDKFWISTGYFICRCQNGKYSYLKFQDKEDKKWKPVNPVFLFPPYHNDIKFIHKDDTSLKYKKALRVNHFIYDLDELLSKESDKLIVFDDEESMLLYLEVVERS